MVQFHIFTFVLISLSAQTPCVVLPVIRQLIAVTSAFLAYRPVLAFDFMRQLLIVTVVAVLPLRHWIPSSVQFEIVQSVMVTVARLDPSTDMPLTRPENVQFCTSSPAESFAITPFLPALLSIVNPIMCQKSLPPRL